jgi:hypothetical protein
MGINSSSYTADDIGKYVWTSGSPWNTMGMHFPLESSLVPGLVWPDVLLKARALCVHFPELFHDYLVASQGTLL